MGPPAAGVRLATGTGRVLLATTVLGSTVAMLTATVVNVALPAVAEDLGASSSGQQWVVNAYLVTLSALILVGGSLGDRYGRVRVYRIGLVWFGAASLACALAPNLAVLVVARALQGVGAALLTPGSLAIIEATVDREDRGRAVGAWSGLTGVSGAIGPLVGGLLVDASWRLVFVLNLPIAVVTLVLSAKVPESVDEGAGRHPLDVVGAGLAVASLGAASYALIEGPGAGAEVLVVAVAAVAATAGLIVRERGRRGAIVPIELFGDRTFSATNAVTFLVYGGMGLVFFLLAIQLQVVAGWSPVAAGAALVPVTLLLLLLSPRAGDVARRTGPRLPLTLGPLLIAAGMVLLRRVDADTTFLADVLPAVTVFGLGLAVSVAPLTATVLGAAPDHRAGAASGVNNAVSRTGQLLAIAAIPPLVGLTGDSLGEAGALDVGFDRAMLVAAVLVAAGAATAAWLLTDQPVGAPASRASCPVDGTQPSSRAA